MKSKIDSMNSKINNKFDYDSDKWVVSIINTAPGKGHSVIVVEGQIKVVDEKFFPTYKEFIGQYDISANAQDVGYGCGINTSGYITKIRCYENEQCTRDYEKAKYPSKSFWVTPSDAQAMIDSIKNDADYIQNAWDTGNVDQLLKYQNLGKHHPLVELFGEPDKGDNCTGWCLEKLAIAGIGDGKGKPKPTKQTESNCMIF